MSIYNYPNECVLPLPNNQKLSRQFNLKHFFTGKQCNRGHVSVRTVSGHCVKCNEINNKDFHKKNPDLSRDKSTKFRERNPDYMSSHTREYAKNNPDKVNAWNANRRAKKLNQTPENANKELILDFYKRAKELNEIYGCDLQVDHIHPIDAGGFHHEDNLQLLPQKLNASKGAKTDWIHPNIID